MTRGRKPLEPLPPHIVESMRPKTKGRRGPAKPWSGRNNRWRVEDWRRERQNDQSQFIRYTSSPFWFFYWSKSLAEAMDCDNIIASPFTGETQELYSKIGDAKSFASLLVEHDGSIDEMAKALGVERNKLTRRLHELNLNHFRDWLMFRRVKKSSEKRF